MRIKTNRHRAGDKNLYALLGFLLGLGGPTGWLVWRALSSHPDWLKNEFNTFGVYYAYLGIGTVLVFTLFGYFLGRRSDIIVDQSEAVKKALEKVSVLAITDALTNVHNARYLHKQLSIELESAKRYNSPLTCLMLDIDNFKTVNDKHGHLSGDVVLTTLAKILRQYVRRVDIVGRLGGEEFLVVMPHTSSDTAFQIAERIRQAVQRWPFKVEETEIPITVSIGVACYPGTGIDDKSALLKASDDALYDAKRAGKNRTALAKEPAATPPQQRNS
jgi:diguanylate cyclase (GGDEF)-like protein